MAENVNVSQNEIDDIIASLTGLGGGGGGTSTTAGANLDLGLSGLGGLTTTVADANEKKSGAGKKKEEIDTENIPLLLDVKMRLSVILGNTKKSIREVLDLGKGSIVELDRFVEEDVDIYINDQLVGKGQIVAIDDEYGVKVTKILQPVKKSGFAK